MAKESQVSHQLTRMQALPGEVVSNNTLNVCALERKGGSTAVNNKPRSQNHQERKYVDGVQRKGERDEWSGEKFNKDETKLLTLMKRVHETESKSSINE